MASISGKVLVELALSSHDFFIVSIFILLAIKINMNYDTAKIKEIPRMKKIELKEYISGYLGITFAEAATQVGVTQQHLEAVSAGRIPAGRPLCVKLFNWSKGKIDLFPLMMVERKKSEKGKEHDNMP